MFAESSRVRATTITVGKFIVRVARFVGIATINLVSFGDLVAVGAVALVAYGVDLVYGRGYACITAGAILIIMAYLGDLAAMAALVFHGNRSRKDSGKQ